MVRAKAIEMWECAECGEWYAGKGHANECCSYVWSGEGRAGTGNACTCNNAEHLSLDEMCPLN